MAMAIFASPWAIRWAIDGVLFMARLYLALLNNIARSALVKLINAQTHVFFRKLSRGTALPQ